MPATVIDGKALAAATKAEAAEKVRELKSRGINPCLAVILVGENPASQVYVRGKINDCAQCGIESRSINLPADTTQDALLAEVKKLADDSAVHGILVQLPLPAQIDEKAVIDAIPPEKDVDGFSPVNVGRMQLGEPCYLPCTPAGCISMIESTGTDIAGKKAVVIQKIDNLSQTGQVRINDIEWMARTESDGETIQEDSVVEIESVRGVKLIVKKCKEDL